MKNIKIKLALAGFLLINMINIDAIGRLAVLFGQKTVQPSIQSVYARFSNPLLKQVKQLNEATNGHLVSRLRACVGGKGYVEKMRDNLHSQVQKGNVPDFEDLYRFDQACVTNKYGALNLPDKNGETLLKATLEMPESKKRTSLLRALYARGAKLNIHDICVMGPEKVLKAELNVPMEASAFRTIKALRTFLTKNTSERAQRNFAFLGIKEERLQKVEYVKTLAKEIEPDLLARRAQEQTQAKRDKRMPVV
jgi:hypothetical protein